ncbi:uncharacterized protein LOC117643277 [Thrips palmi]|uniref:Uncharacterized protein LOC117643277 n=1 Tax=Thrips palmi TaxID=161013 RepID=A0A6P8YM82_THRPL|nr:uncharacterized protein LOC117643277 [Thrips palmi]
MTTADFKNCVELMAPHIRDIAGMVKSCEKVIASKRRCSLIQNFQELVMILVRRLFVDPDDESTWANLNDLCIKYGGQPFYTPKSSTHLSAQNLQQQRVSPLHSNVSHGAPDLLDPNGDIVNYLSENIRYSWRNFARGLKVKGGTIDKIEMTCGSDDHEACMRAVLADYKKNKKWASESNGDVLKDIYQALTLLQKEYLLKEFQRLTGRFS